MSVYRYRGFGGLRGLGRLRARRTPRRLARSRANGTCAYVRLWVGLVVRYGCEVRLCDPCVRVSRVPCVPDSPTWSAGTATTLAEITTCEMASKKGESVRLADDVARIRWTRRARLSPRSSSRRRDNRIFHDLPRCLSASWKIAARANACACESKTIIYRNLTRLQSLMSGRTDLPIQYQHQQRARQI